MFETIITQEGDTVDLIAFTRFGVHGMEPAIWLANPGLADLDPILPAGMAIIVPVPGVADRTTSDRLWS